MKRMTLFAKTLLWFLGTTIITMVAITVVTALSFNSGGGRPFGMFLRLQLSEARRAYETGGPTELANELSRIAGVTHTEGALLDANGRDLVTGEDKSDLTKGTEPQPNLPLFRRNRTVIARRSNDGKYWYVMQTNRTHWFGWFFSPRNNLVVLCVLIVFCYAFARYLTNPVARMKWAVERFGKGDLQSRVELNRRDELGDLAKAFNEMAARIQTLLTAERRLLQDISHELRSPLARLGVAVELARNTDKPEVQLDRIEKEAERLNTLVGELLQVTRAEGDPASRRVEPVRLDEIVREVVEDSSIEAQSRGCRLEYHNGRAITVSGDAELLRRAIENIVRNAIRYAPPETAVEVSLREDGHVIVRDYGPGVPDDALARIFDPFYRVDSDRNRNSGGVGLGLAIARRAVELHHGKISARNAKPGLEVDVALPV